MCGFFGSVGPHLSSSRKDSILQHLNTRGPTSHGFTSFPFRGRSLTFIHSRLAIQDLTEYSNQPFSVDAFGLSTIYNGEIYNLSFLKSILKSYTHHICLSDTELILYLYHYLGIECFSLLSGIFSIAIFDRNTEQIILARDRLGIKPLYYHASYSGFEFGSTVHSLSLAQAVSHNNLSQSAIASYSLWGSVDAPSSIYSHIEEFPAGSVGIFSTELSIQPFPSHPAFVERSPTDFLNLFDSAISDQLVGVDHACVFLSGGLDSSLLATSISSKLPGSTTSLSLSFPDFPSIDEHSSSSNVANLLRINHCPIPVTLGTFENTFDDFIGHLDQPSIDGFNTYLISSAAVDHGFKVAFSGLGADELFYGYPHMATSSISRFVSSRLIRHHGVSSTLLKAILSRRFEFVKTQGLSAYEISFYLKNTLLRDSDCFSQSQGLELRVPFLDNKIVDYALSKPPPEHLSSGPKSILHQLAVELSVPIQQLPKKGFNLPLGHWLLSSTRFSPSRICRLLMPLSISRESILLSWLEMKVSPRRYAAYWRWVVLAEWLVANR